jgi:hypothetical protein
MIFGRERRTEVQAEIACTECGANIQLIAETEEWTRKGLRWVHTSYGPAQGVCEECSILYLDTWDGCYAYRLREQTT